MSDTACPRIVGCLLDVSGSMLEALEAGRSDERAVERLLAILRAALKVAQAEQRHDPGSLVFVGLFGLNTTKNPGCPPGVDLCSFTEAIIGDESDHRSGHERLITLANEENRPNITRYIRKKLTDDEARILHAHLQRHPERVLEFVHAIPPPEEWESKRNEARTGGKIFGSAASAAIAVVGGPLTLPVLGAAAGPAGFLGAVAVGYIVGDKGAAATVDILEDKKVEDSDALRLARSICNEWLAEFASLTPRPVADVIFQLQRLQKRMDTNSENILLDTLRRYLYGMTPMKDTLRQSLTVFREHRTAKQRILLLVSDGLSTDGDPLPQVRELEQEKPEVTIGTVFLTVNRGTADRRIYDRPCRDWHEGQQILFSMASKVSIDTHPIPVLATIGWDIPSSGIGALYATVCSATALEEFCSMLVSARFGAADALLNIVGRLSLDKVIDDGHVRTCRRPSDQKRSPTCYAHAVAAVIHMALIRIIGRVGGYPSIRKIRERILASFPRKPLGHSIEDVLNMTTEWYPPLQFREVNEDGARQAVLRRRPVLATFFLSAEGWEVFSEHFTATETSKVPLMSTKMAGHRSSPADGGHAVVLIRCEPQSLTFLNSWGKEWGDKGSFSIQDHTVLELDEEGAHMRFYDVYWEEKDLKDAEKKAFDFEVDQKLSDGTKKHPSLLDLEARCPHCNKNSPIAKFQGRLGDTE
ncbi:Uncharacterized protein J7T55_000911 [Diaporthe amygdali]|uniref:uncharacterized protein n=1 Tax=Phomopsis amygdali TaxID=1214568 RepID=UPI0022FDC632|nr:uncharacterized protein J7T55_000911 [Diaporthe amygdali]KAJ0120058.1 Uncharacterized protein J7T55_000911 [Diaporthe amygdali]